MSARINRQFEKAEFGLSDFSRDYSEEYVPDQSSSFRILDTTVIKKFSTNFITHWEKAHAYQIGLQWR